MVPRSLFGSGSWLAGMDGTMSYPTIEQLRQHEAHALKQSAEYRAEGNAIKAEQREEDAAWYAIMIYREEWRLAHLKPMEKAA